MKALPFKIPALASSSIRVDREILKEFYPHLHTHQELQLIWIIKGSGTAFIGDKIQRFNSGEIYFLSSNLAHVFKSDPSINQVESISIYFDPTFLGLSFFSLPETTHLNKFLKGFKQGLMFLQLDKTPLKSFILDIEYEKGIRRITLLIEMLEHISILEPKLKIASTEYSSPSNRDGEKINDIIGFLYNNYAQNIRLEEIAERAHMTPPAFCRYFKRHTRKSMVKYLNEIRIGKVCGWLQEKKYTVTESCYQAGFNNISNFNRQFKMVTGFTPSTYIVEQNTIAK